MKPNSVSRQSRKQWSHSQIANGQFALCFVDTGQWAWTKMFMSSICNAWMEYDRYNICKFWISNVCFQIWEIVREISFALWLHLIRGFDGKLIKGGGGLQVKKPSFWWISDDSEGLAHSLCPVCFWEKASDLIRPRAVLTRGRSNDSRRIETDWILDLGGTQSLAWILCKVTKVWSTIDQPGNVLIDQYARGCSAHD